MSATPATLLAIRPSAASMPNISATAASDASDASTATTDPSGATNDSFGSHLKAAKDAGRDISKDDASDSSQAKPGASDADASAADPGQAGDAAKASKPSRHATDDNKPAVATAAATAAVPTDAAAATVMLNLLGQRNAAPAGSDSGGTSSTAASAVATATGNRGAAMLAVGLSANKLADDDTSEDGEPDDNAAAAGAADMTAGIAGTAFANAAGSNIGTGLGDKDIAATGGVGDSTSTATNSSSDILQGLAAMANGGADAGANINATHQLSASSPAGSASFAQELGQQVSWLSTQDIKQANIRLHPEELGQLEVKVSLSHNRVDVSFAAQHPAAIQAVQQSLGQLDQMLGAQGMSLGQTSVGQQSNAQQQFGTGGGSSQSSGTTSRDDADESPSVASVSLSRQVGLVDTFA